MAAPQPPEHPNVVTLLHYTERLFAEHQREHALLAEANRVALTSLNDRMEGINEFRGQLRDQAGTFATRDMHTAQGDRIARLENARARSDGQWAVIVGASSVLSATIAAGLARLLFG